MAKVKKGKKPTVGDVEADLVDLAEPVEVDRLESPAGLVDSFPTQRFYDLPYSAPAPRMTNPDVNLQNLVSRAGRNAAYEIDVTVLDAPDHRLMRSGVLLAHRVLEGRGDWYLTAPDWRPLLPSDRVELMGHVELPEVFADLIRPLRRRATLGPVAALHCDRREFALRDGTGSTVALLRDDRVTVRRGGLTTARYREVLITPVGRGLGDEQVAWLDRALNQSGATQLRQFPGLVTRLGAPATGPSDLPDLLPFDAEVPLKRFVSQLFARRVRSLIQADLLIRGGDLGAISRLVEDAERLRRELSGLAPVLDPEWREDLCDELSWLISGTSDLLAGPWPADGSEGELKLAARLRSERYLTLLERLVAAIRAPKLTEARSRPTEEILDRLVADGLLRLRRTADDLAIDSDPQLWEESWLEVGRLHRCLDVARLALPEVAELMSRLAEPYRLLTQIHLDGLAESVSADRLPDLSAAAAFELGRGFERNQALSAKTRRAFVKRWRKATAKLDARLPLS